MSKLSNAVWVSHLLLKSLNFKHSRNRLKKLLENHVDYPSLLSISDGLTSWGIENQAYRLRNDDFDRLESPYLAHVNLDGGKFILIRSISKNVVEFSNDFENLASMSRTDFALLSTGAVLKAELGTQRREPQLNLKRLKFVSQSIKIPLFCALLAVGLLLHITHQQLTLQYYLLVTLNFLGLLVTTLLLTSEITKRGILIQKLCKVGTSNGCSTILGSEISKVTSWLSWSEVGFFYFVGYFTALIINPVSLPILTWLSIASLPYAFYSLITQYRLKTWCILCCLVQTIFILSALTAIFVGFPIRFSIFNHNVSNKVFELTFDLLISFVFPVLIWYTIKPFLVTYEESNLLRREYKTLKYNADYFNYLLKSTAQIPINNDIMPIVLGSFTAKNVITIVSSPFCEPCAVAHKKVDEWLNKGHDIQIKVIFNTSNYDIEDRTKFSRHMNALNRLNDAELTETALKDWFSQSVKKYEIWAKKYPVFIDDVITDVTRKQKEWCKMANITFTPTVFVNGYQLPDPYLLEDLEYLIN